MNKFIFLLIFSLFYSTILFAEVNCNNITSKKLLQNQNCLNEFNAIDNNYQIIKDLLQSEDSDEAYFLLNKITEENIKKPLYYELKFLSLYDMGEDQQALDIYNKFLKENKNEEVSTKYILILIKQGDLKLAEKNADFLLYNHKDNYNFIKGIIDLKTKKYYSAKNYFDKVSHGSPYYQDSQLYIAEACLNTKRMGCSEEYYNKAINDKDYLKFKLDSLEEQKLKFHFFAMLGEQYDSNVTSVDKQYTGISEKDSMRTYIVANLGAEYNFKYDIELSVKINNYAAWNHSVSEYDNNIHSFETSLVKRFDNFSIKLPELKYELTYMDGDSYLNMYDIGTGLNVYFGSFEFEIPLSYKNKDFKASDFDNGRDSEVYSGGVVLKYNYNDTLYSKLTFNYDKEDAKEKYFDNDLTSVDISAYYKILEYLTFGLDYSYGYYDYKEGRNDQHNRITAIATYQFNAMFSVALDASYIDHSSNIDEYKYDKYLAGAAIIFEY